MTTPRNAPVFVPARSRFPSGARNDVFPLPPAAPAELHLTAVTVFTTYEVPAPAVPGRISAPPHIGAICACGSQWQHDSRQLLRRMLGGHSCAAERGRPAELVPIDDEPSDDTLLRVLAGLREL